VYRLQYANATSAFVASRLVWRPPKRGHASINAAAQDNAPLRVQARQAQCPFSSCPRFLRSPSGKPGSEGSPPAAAPRRMAAPDHHRHDRVVRAGRESSPQDVACVGRSRRCTCRRNRQGCESPCSERGGRGSTTWAAWGAWKLADKVCKGRRYEGALSTSGSKSGRRPSRFALRPSLRSSWRMASRKSTRALSRCPAAKWRFPLS
jgi:hypothetical protein